MCRIAHMDQVRNEVRRTGVTRESCLVGLSSVCRGNLDTWREWRRTGLGRELWDPM